MRWLIRADTRHARLVVLRLRARALRYGDDFAETYLTLDATIYGFVLLLPGNTMKGSAAWSTIDRLSGGDVGLGLMFTALAVGLWLSLFRLVPETVRAGILVTTFAVWVGMAVGFFFGYPSALGAWVGCLNIVTAWIAYLRIDK